VDSLLHRLPAKAGRGESLREGFARRFAGWLKLADLLVYPSFCEICRCFLEKPGEKVVCRECLSQLRPRLSAHCHVCGRFFEGAGESHLCGACLKSPPPFSRHRSYTKYEGLAKDVILLFKYRGSEILGRRLAELIGGALGGEDDLWDGVDAVVPVPLHPRKLRKRGYNQAAVLARHLAGLKGTPFAGNRLLKVRNNPAQTSLDAAGREANVRGAYLIRNPGPLTGRVVLLVDDVFTTGATIGECSRTLLRAGAREVRAVTFAQA
jgi:competence protein ComFC